MKKLFVSFFIGLALSFLSVSACSKKEKAKQDKGKIEKMTDKAAEVVVTKIRTPMDRAHSVKEAEKERAKEMDAALQEQH